MTNGGNELPSVEPIKLTFGEIEARLARMHEIASDKRTQFQARLRNFQKLGLPEGVASGRGKTVYYRPGHVVELALALELTQLGLLPERLVNVVRLNKFPIYMAVRMAARDIINKGGFLPDRERSASGENMPQNTGSHWASHDEADDPMSMFLYFDPSTLAHLMPSIEHDEDMASATFFYGGPGIIRENIVRWTAGPHIRRIALINVTAMLWSLVNRTKPENQKQFMAEVIEWSEVIEEAYFVDTVRDDLTPENVVLIESYEDVVKHADLLRAGLHGVPPTVAEAMIRVAQMRIEEGRSADQADVREAVNTMTGTEAREEVARWLSLSPNGMPPFTAEVIVEKIIRLRKDRGDTIDDQTLLDIGEAVASLPMATAMTNSVDRLKSRRSTPTKPKKKGFNLREWLTTVSKEAGAVRKKREAFANEFKDTPDGRLTDVIDVSLPYVIEPEDRSGPDLVVLVPGNQRLEINAKLATDLSLKAIRASVDQLAAPDATQRSSISQRLLFVPSERALLDAFEEDPTLWDYAFDRDVLIVAPQHMAMMMSSIKKVWAQHGSTPEGRDELGTLAAQKLEGVDGDR